MKRLLLSGFAGLLLLAVSSPAPAATFSYSFSGTVTSVDLPLTGVVPLGTPFTLSFTYFYEPLALTTFVLSPEQMIYFGGTSTGIVGPALFTPTTTGVFNNISVDPLTGLPLPSTRDVVSFTVPASGFIFSGYSLDQVQVRLIDLSALAIMSAVFPNLNQFASLVDRAVLQYRFVNALGQQAYLIGIGETPLPPALILFLTGLGVMGFLAKRKARTAATAA